MNGFTTHQMINSKNVQQVNVNFQTLMAPPPYSHQYQFTLKLQASQLQAAYHLTYTERTSLTEEEIYEEGFTPDDDFSWEGALSAAWQEALQEMLAKTNKLKPNLSKDQPNLIRLHLTDTERQIQEGIPDNLEGWEYFLQEMTQAVFELSRKEQALVIRYREIDQHKQALEITVKPTFSKRQLHLDIQQNGKLQHKTVAWQHLKPLLKAIYLPDYDSTKAVSALPTRPGQYIDPGEGVWYNMKKDLTNPGKQYDAIGAMEKEITNLM